MSTVGEDVAFDGLESVVAEVQARQMRHFVQDELVGFAKFGEL